MLFKIIAIVFVVSLISSYLLSRAICMARVRRSNRAFANLPKEVLLHYVQLSPVYSSCYKNARLTMTEDRAADHAINNMLFNMGINKYRKGRT